MNDTAPRAPDPGSRSRRLVDDRGVSEVVAVALLLGIVVLGIGAILVLAGPALMTDQESAQLGQAERSLTQFDAEAARVALEGTDAQRIDLGMRGNAGTLDVQDDAGHITVTFRDSLTERNETTVMDESLGAVVYESGETTVAYQGGGVWRSDRDGSVMISPPEFSNDRKTLTMPVVTVRKGGSVHSDVQIAGVASSERFPNETAEVDLTNKVDAGIITITIESRYYEAWAQYLREETQADVWIPEEGTVIARFYGSTFNLGQEAGIIATSGPGELRIEGSGSYIDSYNSSEGPYDTTSSTEGVVKSAGNIDLFGGAEIWGDAESEGKILLDGSSRITGNASAPGGEDDVEVGGDAEIEGEIRDDPNVPILPPLDHVVEEQYNEVKADNDNDDTDGRIQDDRLVFDHPAEGPGELELQPGAYYLEAIEMEDGETLRLNATQGGDFTIVVENYVVLDEGHIEVLGEEDGGDVKMYIASKASSGITIPGTGGEPADHFYVDSNSKVSVHNDKSPRFQILAPRDFTGAIRASGSNDPQVVAAILAPTPGSEGSQFIVRDGELFGAVVTGNLSIENGGEVHFDRGILGADIPFGEGSLLDYLYISENEIEVKGS